MANFFSMIARSFSILLYTLLPLMTLGQDIQTIQVTVTDEELAPLDSITVALINRVSGDTLDSKLTDEVGFVEFLDVLITSDEIQPSIPNLVQLSPGYPNPFSQNVSVTAQFNEDSKVIAEVYNTLGQRVLRIPEQRLTAGAHTLNLQMGGLVDGVYFVRLFHGEQVFTQQVTKVGSSRYGVLNGNWSVGGITNDSRWKSSSTNLLTDLVLVIDGTTKGFSTDTIRVESSIEDYQSVLNSLYMSATIRIKNTVTNELREGAVLLYTPQGVLIDSVYTNTGEVNISIPQQDSVLVLAKPMMSGFEYGSGGQELIIANGADFSKTFPVITRMKYDENLNPTGELFTDRELGVLYWIGEVVHGREGVPGLFSGDTRTRVYQGEFHRGEYTGIILADTTEYQDGRINIMKQNVKDINIDLFVNKISQLYDFTPPQIEDLADFLYDTSNRPENKGVILSTANLGGISGSNNTYGDDAYLNLHGFIRTLTNMSDGAALRIAVEEQVPTFIYYSNEEADATQVRNQIPMIYWANSSDTRMFDDSGFNFLSNIDVSLGALINDEHMIPGTKVRNGIVMPKKFLTKEWNQYSQ